ncbi:MAG: molybdopterin molybdotransferase MoeA [Alphaproteobacteria bacterium]|nr:molybdopterin molybdotransferase MoeA [Alphaproteobacteria bacterium]
MISVEEALERILAGMRPLGTEQVSLAEALGRVLAVDVAARVSHPSAAVSAMDGYAVRSHDVTSVPATLKVIGQSAAGHPFGGKVGRGEAVRTFTGAVVPDGADAIVIQEDTTAGNGAVTVHETVGPGRFIRAKGTDFTEGDILLRAGRQLSFRDIGLAAAMNVPWLQVSRRPRIAILSTGDEVMLPGDRILPGQLVGANGFALAAFVTAAGGVPVDLGIALDDRDSLLSLAAGAKGADLLITSGGVSVGDHDLVQQVLGEVGLEVNFWKVAVRPGKPMVFGHMGDVPLLGFPGNPVAAMVGALLFLGPAMRALQGLPPQPAPRVTAALARDLPANDVREDYLRATLHHATDGTLMVDPFESQDSAQMARLAQADCLAIRPPLAPPAKAGNSIEIILLDQETFQSYRIN